MQENRDRSTVCFVSKPREASSERMPTRQLDRGDAERIRRISPIPQILTGTVVDRP
jgi:hypothetical protein